MTSTTPMSVPYPSNNLTPPEGNISPTETTQLPTFPQAPSDLPLSQQIESSPIAIQSPDTLSSLPPSLSSPPPSSDSSDLVTVALPGNARPPTLNAEKRNTILHASRQQAKEMFQTTAFNKIEQLQLLRELMNKVQSLYPSLRKMKAIYSKLTNRETGFPAYITITKDFNALDLLLSMGSVAGDSIKFWLAREISNAKLTDNEKKTLLAQASYDKWNRTKLRKEIRSLRQKNKIPVVPPTEKQIIRVLSKYMYKLSQLPSVTDTAALDVFINTLTFVKERQQGKLNNSSTPL